jgi:hypothetical protein
MTSAQELDDLAHIGEQDVDDMSHGNDLLSNAPSHILFQGSGREKSSNIHWVALRMYNLFFG